MVLNLRDESPLARCSQRRRARAVSRGTVWRKPKAKSRGDEQEPDVRCDADGASGHVTAKPSSCEWPAFYKFGVYAMKAKCLTPGGLHCVEGATDDEAIHGDRNAEVSRGHSARCRAGAGPNKSGSSVWEVPCDCICLDHSYR